MIKKESRKKLRCAIYTRKSTDEGLEQEFNSLDAQRMASESYVASQVHEGWVCLPERYDDGGFTGANMERPALGRLMRDIEEGRIDIVVVYKVDRLSRSLLDFAKIIDLFDKRNVSFVSITQNFKTTDSMGRLTLNILLSFAQFEREIISERTRDKVALSRKQGKWTGGPLMLGYDVAPDKASLDINELEAKRVKEIFELYIETGSLGMAARELKSRGWHGKTWRTKDGRTHEGKPFTKASLHYLLTNPLYIGKVRHKGKLYDGEHKAIIEEGLFQRVQDSLLGNRSPGRPRSNSKRGGILRHLLFCGHCNRTMTHTYTKKGDRLYRYYVCENARENGWNACPHPSMPATEIERFVVNEVSVAGQDAKFIAEVVRRSEEAQGASRENLRAEDMALRKRMKALSGELQKNPRIGTARLAEMQEEMASVEKEATRVREKLAMIESSSMSKGEIGDFCRKFTPVWERLASAEQARFLGLLLEKVVFDPEAEELNISYRASGIKALNENLQLDAG